MDMDAIQSALVNIATEASRFGAETALAEKTGTLTDDLIHDQRVSNAVHKALLTIRDEYLLSTFKGRLN